MKFLHFLGHNWTIWSEPQWLYYKSVGIWQERKCKDCNAIEIREVSSVLAWVVGN